MTRRRYQYQHNRQSHRLRGWDYSQTGLYFITICCQDRICRFGHVADNTMVLNEYGRIAYKKWAALPERFPRMVPDDFQIMPNHMHGIIRLIHADPNRTTVGAPARDRAPARDAPTVGEIVGAYKSLVANGCLNIYKSRNESMGRLWQRNYYDHVIRDYRSYQNIANYIRTNPARWNEDNFYPSN